MCTSVSRCYLLFCKWNLQVFLKQKNRSYFSAFQKRWDLAERSSWNMWCKWIGYGSNNCKWIDVILRSKNIVFNNVGIFSSIQLLWKSYITFSIPSTSHNPLLNWCATYNHFIPVFKNIAYDIYLECLYYKNHLEWSDFKIFEKIHCRPSTFQIFCPSTMKAKHIWAKQEPKFWRE